MAVPGTEGVSVGLGGWEGAEVEEADAAEADEIKVEVEVEAEAEAEDFARKHLSHIVSECVLNRVPGRKTNVTDSCIQYSHCLGSTKNNASLESISPLQR